MPPREAAVSAGVRAGASGARHVLLMLGTDFPYRQFYPQGGGARIAQVDLRAEQIGRRAPVDIGVVGDVKATLAAVLPLLQQKWDGAHLAQAREHYAKARKALDDLAAPGEGLIHPQQIAKAISDHAAQDAVFTCDVGLRASSASSPKATRRWLPTRASAAF